MLRSVKALMSPLARERGAEQKARETDPLRGEFLDGALDLVRVGNRKLRIAAPAAIAIRVHDGDGAHVGASRTRRREQRAHLHDGRRVAVIGPIGGDDAEAATAIARDAQRELVRLAAGAAEHGHRELPIEQRHQPLGVSDHVLVEVTRMGVERAGLAV
jgi:hypothetical protein